MEAIMIYALLCLAVASGMSLAFVAAVAIALS
mgnify:CR=1 FL=1